MPWYSRPWRSWPHRKIALYGDDRIKGGQVSAETVKGVVLLRGTVDSDDAKAAAASVAQDDLLPTA